MTSIVQCSVLRASPIQEDPPRPTHDLAILYRSSTLREPRLCVPGGVGNLRNAKVRMGNLRNTPRKDWRDWSAEIRVFHRIPTAQLNDRATGLSKYLTDQANCLYCNTAAAIQLNNKLTNIFVHG